MERRLTKQMGEKRQAMAPRSLRDANAGSFARFWQCHLGWFLLPEELLEE